MNDWHPGDEVFGCGGGVKGVQGGALAEFILVDADSIARKPKRLSMRQSGGLASGPHHGLAGDP